ncbi:hypothetical protein [Streptomyces murinus]|uniref:hypothetical protein n=1 Tax=Streptomyces murinus TaxID=33900 RepID=UPI002114DCE9|nr:hypothetical protein [Streptomyces murinus]
MTVILSILFGAVAGALVTAASSLGRRGRPSNVLSGLIALVLALPFLWWWAWRTDQFPATFGTLAVAEIAWQTHLRRQRRHPGGS